MTQRRPISEMNYLSPGSGEGSGPSRPGFQHSVSTEDLREYFECPVCYEVPRAPPIFACQQGHMLCGQCRPQLRTCPLCRIPLGNLTRLFFAEKLLEERIPLACKNAEQGCKVELISDLIKKHETQECPYTVMRCENGENGCRETVPRMNMKEHLEMCDWRPVDCPVPSCGAKLPRTKVLIHLQNCHLSVFAGGRLDSRTSLFVLFFVISLLLNCIFYWQISQSDA